MTVMTESAARAKLGETREALWDEVARVRGGKVPGLNFPRSQAMQLLLGGGSPKKALWAAGLGLLALKPQFARTVLSLAPGLLRAFFR